MHSDVLHSILGSDVKIVERKFREPGTISVRCCPSSLYLLCACLPVSVDRIVIVLSGG